MAKKLIFQKSGGNNLSIDEESIGANLWDENTFSDYGRYAPVYDDVANALYMNVTAVFTTTRPSLDSTNWRHIGTGGVDGGNVQSITEDSGVITVVFEDSTADLVFNAGHTIQNNGTDVDQKDNLNFSNGLVASSPTGDTTEVTAPGIGTNAGGISTNAGNIATNVQDIAQNVSDIATNVTGIATNATGISNNGGDIITNQGNIAANLLNINSNRSDIDTNTGNIETNTGNVETNQREIAENTRAIDHIRNTNELIDDTDVEINNPETGDVLVLDGRTATCDLSFLSSANASGDINDPGQILFSSNDNLIRFITIEWLAGQSQNNNTYSYNTGTLHIIMTFTASSVTAQEVVTRFVAIWGTPDATELTWGTAANPRIRTITGSVNGRTNDYTFNGSYASVSNTIVRWTAPVADMKLSSALSSTASSEILATFRQGAEFFRNSDVITANGTFPNQTARNAADQGQALVLREDKTGYEIGNSIGSGANRSVGQLNDVLIEAEELDQVLVTKLDFAHINIVPDDNSEDWILTTNANILYSRDVGTVTDEITKIRVIYNVTTLPIQRQVNYSITGNTLTLVIIPSSTDDISRDGLITITANALQDRFDSQTMVEGYTRIGGWNNVSNPDIIHDGARASGSLALSLDSSTATARSISLISFPGSSQSYTVNFTNTSGSLTINQLVNQIVVSLNTAMRSSGDDFRFMVDPDNSARILVSANENGASFDGNIQFRVFPEANGTGTPLSTGVIEQADSFGNIVIVSSGGVNDTAFTQALQWINATNKTLIGLVVIRGEASMSYSRGNLTWENKDIELNLNTDVNIFEPVENQALRYKGNQWTAEYFQPDRIHVRNDSSVNYPADSFILLNEERDASGVYSSGAVGPSGRFSLRNAFIEEAIPIGAIGTAILRGRVNFPTLPDSLSLGTRVVLTSNTTVRVAEDYETADATVWSENSTDDSLKAIDFDFATGRIEKPETQYTPNEAFLTVDEREIAAGSTNNAVETSLEFDNTLNRSQFDPTAFELTADFKIKLLRAGVYEFSFPYIVTLQSVGGGTLASGTIWRIEPRLQAEGAADDRAIFNKYAQRILPDTTITTIRNQISHIVTAPADNTFVEVETYLGGTFTANAGDVFSILYRTESGLAVNAEDALTNNVPSEQIYNAVTLRKLTDGALDT